MAEEHVHNNMAEELVSLIDRGEIDTVGELKAYIRRAGERFVINDTDSKGRTPLMLACRELHTDLVEVLLDMKADPNLACKEGNTALHFACDAHYLNVDYNSSESADIEYENRDHVTRPRRQIVKLLWRRGAVQKCNAVGFSPLLCAALHGMKGIVECLLKYDSNISKMEKIDAFEILASTMAIHYDLGMQNFVFDWFQKAMILRYENPDEIIHKHSPPHRTYGDQRESRNLDDLRKIENDYGLQAVEALLVLDRILPAEIKATGQYLWRPVFYSDVTDDPQYMKKGIGFLLASDTISSAGAEIMLEVLDEELSEEHKCAYEMMFPSFCDVTEILESITSIIAHATSIGLDSSKYIAASIGGILHILVWQCDKEEEIDKICCIMEKCMEHLWSKVCVAENLTDKKARTCVSTIPAFIYNFGYSNNSLNEVSVDRVEVCRRVRHFLHRMLSFEDVDYTTEDADSLLHFAVFLYAKGYDFAITSEIVLVLIRHGCSIYKMCACGEMPIDVARSYSKDDYQLPELLESAQHCLNLQELAARVLLRHKIPYETVLPRLLCDVVEGKTELVGLTV